LLVEVVINTTPSGAEVYSANGKLLGKTPAKLSLPITREPFTYELRLAGYRKKTRQVVITGNTVIEVPLERIVVIRKNPGGGSGGTTSGGAGHRGSSDDLERP
jgi:hypothetical protein